jgi:hypothetical protein
MTNWSKVSLGLPSGPVGVGGGGPRPYLLPSDERRGLGAGRLRLLQRGCDELDARVGTEDELDARLDDAAEPLADPAARVHGRLDDESVPGELDATKRLQPDAVGGLVDDECKLGLRPRPYVLELAVHGSGGPLLSQRKC